MPIFYFDISVNAEKSADVNGIELASAEEAHKLALEDIRLLTGYGKSRTGTSYCVLEVLDENRILLFRFPFFMNDG
jgi:hypothetical protein